VQKHAHAGCLQPGYAHHELDHFFLLHLHELRQQAKEQDGSRIFIFIILLISALGSMLSSLVLLNKSKHDIQGFELGIAVAGMIFSWLLVHTVFTYRYAHVYYADDGTEVQTDIKGLEFPDDDKPDSLISPISLL